MSQILELFLFTLGAITLASCATCPTGWTVSPDNPDKCFFYENMQKVEAEAKARCVTLGGNLVSIESLAQQTLVAQLLKTNNVEGYVLTGASTTKPGRTWVWEDGVPFSYTNWMPSTDPNATNANRMYINSYKSSGPSYQWLASYSTTPYNYVCSSRLKPDQCTAPSNGCGNSCGGCCNTCNCCNSCNSCNSN